MKTLAVSCLFVLSALHLCACGKTTEFAFTMSYATSGPQNIAADGSSFLVAAPVSGGESSWASFTSTARQNCGGGTPKEVEILRIELNMIENEGIEDIGEVFSTGVEVFVAPTGSASAQLTTIGTVTGVHGKGPILFKVTPVGQLKALTTDLVNGTLLLGIKGETIRSASDTFSLKLRIAMNLESHC